MVGLRAAFSMYQNVGYHGHTRERIIRTLHRGKFEISCSEDEWLGRGIYFFENDLKQAVDWCVRARKYSSWSIIKAHIATDRLLDLTISSHFDLFNGFVREIQERYQKVAVGEKLTRKKIFDFIYQLEPYDVIRHTFEVPHGGVIPFTNIRRMEVQLCVRNPNSIMSIEEVDLRGL